MVDAIYDALGGVLTRWTMGAAAAPTASVWRDALGDDPVEAELRLLALVGQFLGGMVVAEPAGGLFALPDVPKLVPPPVPAPLRSLVRRIFAREREAGRRRLLLDFLAARGQSMHPGDWMPAANDDDVPDLYAPWRDWAAAAGERTAVVVRDGDELTVESWGDYWPAARNVALTALRRRDPDAARTLLEVKFASEAAEVRLRLLATLATGLSDADRPFLDLLAAGDRAPKVKALATSLLARLGHGGAGGEDAAELAGFFEVQSKGLLRRTKVVAARTLKTAAQTQRRQALLSGVDATTFATALQLDLDGLIGMWRWGDNQQADWAFAGMIERTAPDGAVAQLAELLSGEAVNNSLALLQILPRLDMCQRHDAALQMLDAGASFQSVLSIAGGSGRIDKAIDFPAGASLLDALRPQAEAKSTDQAEELHALGLLASHAAARGALTKLKAIGLLSADPRLDMIRLNAALDDDGEIV